jgi:hypothetical protein
MGSGGEAMCGVIVQIDAASGRAIAIERVQYSARRDSPPFA